MEWIRYRLERVRAQGMIRSWLVSLSWVFLTLLLYGGVIGLDLHWNLFTWQPELDYVGLGLVVLSFVAVVGMGVVASWTRGAWSLGVAGVASVFLVCVGLYVAGAEPLTQEGLIPRVASSPAWYRMGRLALMSLPGVILLIKVRPTSNHFQGWMIYYEL